MCLIRSWGDSLGVQGLGLGTLTVVGLGLDLTPSQGAWGFPGDSEVRNLPAVQELQETQVRFLGQKVPLEEGVATHSCSHLENPMDRGAWWAPWGPCGRREADWTEQLSERPRRGVQHPPLLLTPRFCCWLLRSSSWAFGLFLSCCP